MSDIVERARALRSVIVKNAATMADEDAVSFPELFREWKSGIAITISGSGNWSVDGDDTGISADSASGLRFRRGDSLYKVRQSHTTQDGWEPENAPSLWAGVCADDEAGDSTSNPIEYGGNLELFDGKYYIQDGVVYLCTRNSETPLYHSLSALVGLYVEVVQ